MLADAGCPLALEGSSLCFYVPVYHHNRPTTKIDTLLADVLASRAPGSSPLTFARVSPHHLENESLQRQVGSGLLNEAKSTRRHASFHVVVAPLAKTATTYTERQSFEFAIRL